MKTIKQKAIDAISSLPDTAKTDDIMYRLYVMDKIRQGRQDIKDGKIFTTEEIKKELSTW